jgi:hypothetical protein
MTGGKFDPKAVTTDPPAPGGGPDPAGEIENERFVSPCREEGYPFDICICKKELGREIESNVLSGRGLTFVNNRSRQGGYSHQQADEYLHLDERGRCSRQWKLRRVVWQAPALFSMGTSLLTTLVQPMCVK